MFFQSSEPDLAVDFFFFFLVSLFIYLFWLVYIFPVSEKEKKNYCSKMHAPFLFKCITCKLYTIYSFKLRSTGNFIID